MNLGLLLGTLGAGIGLAAGLAFNVRLARALGTPLAATLVNFVVGGVLLACLWLVGVGREGPAHLPPLWMLTGGLLGATYVTLNLIGAARLGVGVGTVAATLGQLLMALALPALGWLGQAQRPPSATEGLSALLLLAAVALLAGDRQRAAGGRG